MTGRHESRLLNMTGLAVLAVLIVCGTASAEEPLYFPDYISMLSHAAEKPVKPPTAEQIKMLGPLWPDVPPEKNAICYFIKAESLLASTEDAPAGSLEVPHIGPYRGNLKAFADWIEANSDALRAMRTGLEQQECRMPMLFDEEGTAITFCAFRGLRHLARIAGDGGFYEELRRKPEAAVSRYLDVLTLGEMIRREGELADCLTGIHIQAIALDALPAVIADDDLSEVTLRKIIEATGKSEITMDEIRHLWSLDTEFARANAAAIPKDRLYWNPDEYKKFADVITEALGQMSMAALLRQETADALLAGTLRPFRESGSADYVFGWLKSCGFHNVQLNACRVRAAIALCRRDRGDWPDSLDQLCPGYLHSVPIDPFSGGPMRYEKTADGWKLWSVGENNKDDGGQGMPGVRGEPDYVFVSRVQSNVAQRSADGLHGTR